MKKLITIALSMIAFSASAQITLEHDYQNAYNCQVVKLEVEGTKFFTVDTATKKVMVYNADHSFSKAINPPASVSDIRFATLSCISEHFFDSDDQIEFCYTYFDQSVTFRTVVMKENGTILLNLPGVSGCQPIKVNGDWKMAASASYSYKVYSVPGEYTGSTMIKPQTGNGTEASLYPNPMESSAILSYTLPSGTQQGKINIYSSNGVLVKSMDITSQFKEVLIGRDDLPAGVYVYQVTAPNVQPVSAQFVIR